MQVEGGFAPVLAIRSCGRRAGVTAVGCWTCAVVLLPSPFS
jgi:hypothetical protein